MGTPLEHYEEIDFGAKKDPNLKRRPERCFWGAFYLAVAAVFVGPVFYVPELMPYSGVVWAVMIIALLGIGVTTMVGSFLRTHR